MTTPATPTPTGEGMVDIWPDLPLTARAARTQARVLTQAAWDLPIGTADMMTGAADSLLCYAYLCERTTALLSHLAALTAERDALTARVAEAEEHASSSWGCLEMIREDLDHFVGMNGCPPMFYNDAVRSLAYRAALAGMRAVRRMDCLMVSENEARELMKPATGLLLQQKRGHDIA